MGRRRVTCMALLSCNNPPPLSCANHEANGPGVALAISPSNIAISPGRSGLGGGNGLDLKDGVEQVLDDLGLALLAGLLDALDLSVGLLVGLVLGLLVTLAVLHTVGQLSRRGRGRCRMYVPRPRTSCTRPPCCSCSRLSPAWPHREPHERAWCGLDGDAY